MMRRAFFILALMIGFSAAADEHAKEIDNKAYWMCKSKKKVRTIRVQITDDGICQTFYSREGEEKIVGSGKNHESCLNFLNNIKTNLEKSNWTCRDITDTKITASLD
jgi:hypothetical protein